MIALVGLAYSASFPVFRVWCILFGSNIAAVNCARVCEIYSTAEARP